MKKKLRRRHLAMIPTILIALGFLAFLYINSHYESTDDAFVEGRIIRISPKVSGTIGKLYVDDNQHVKKGDLLLEIDPADYQVQVNLTKAKYAQIMFSQPSAKADVAAADQDLNTVTSEYQRYEDLYAKGAVAKQEYEYAKAKYEAAKAKKAAANERVFSQAKDKMADAELKQALSGMQQAELALSYTKIYAPIDGMITNRSAEAGAFINVGAPLFSIVPDERWVIANFKETQLKHMHAGQDVDIKIDAFPQLKLKGKVDSIQASTGSKTSLFPPENAVGSYVKIVQRVPVKIVFNDKLDELDSKYSIAPGMSVVPKVRVK